MRVGGQGVGHPLHHLHAHAFERINLGRIVGHQANRLYAQQVEHPRRHGEIARFIGQAQPGVGIHRIKALILQLIGAQLVDEADAAPFLAQIEQHAPAARVGLLRHRGQRGVQLRPAIAFQAAQHVAGQAFGMQPHQRHAVGALAAQHQGDMLAQVIPAAEGDDFGRLAGRYRQAGAAGDLQMARVFPIRQIGGGHGLRFLHPGGVEQERGQHSGEARQIQRGHGGGGIGDRLGAERAFHRRRQIQRGIGNRAGERQIERFGAANQHGRLRFCRIALVGQFERGGACGGNQHVAGGHPRAKTGFGGQQGPRPHPHRPTMAQRIQRKGNPATRGHYRSNSVISGTWSEHFSQLRASSSTRWARAVAATSGDPQM